MGNRKNPLVVFWREQIERCLPVIRTDYNEDGGRRGCGTGQELSEVRYRGVSFQVMKMAEPLGWLAGKSPGGSERGGRRPFRDCGSVVDAGRRVS